MRFGGRLAMPRMHSLLLAIATSAIALAAPAAAQDYPDRPVRVIVPFPPGGVNDIVGRMIATQLSERLGKQFVVENRTGAASIVGSEIAANAPKDGYTLLVVSIVNAVNPWLYKLPYDPKTAFVPIAFLAQAPTVLVVNPTLPVNSIKELLALAKGKPGEVLYASAGVGSFMHLGGELFKLTAGIDLMHVPFRGGGPAMIDLVAGNTKVGFATTITTSPFIKSGKLKGLGVGALKRSAVLPELPTVAEAGVPDYEVANWIGMVAPAGTPKDIIDKLNKEIAAIQASPEGQKLLAARGAEAVNMSPAEFGAFMTREMAKWERVVREGKIKRE
ncbi:MAG: tripartite tricarboxylate transporter substrate binding protein [Alphaproteobacteria bacterium]|nr:tripartite tricarboxylate transporter substrate binding protein [Alphaproteobacteria bacterium]